MQKQSKVKSPSENLEALAELVLATGSKSELIKAYLALPQEEKDDLMAYMKRLTPEDLYRAIRNHSYNIAK